MSERNEKTSLFWIVPVVPLLLLVGCATSIPSYSRTLNGWVGLNVDDLIQKWGEPSNIASTSEGHSVYSYEVSGTKELPARATYVGGTYKVFPAPTIMETCNTYFEADGNGLIMEASYEGNACP